MPDRHSSIRILLVDDHTLFRRGLGALLSREPDFLVVGEAADAGQAQRRSQELQPDLILLDNHLGAVSGIDALPALQQAVPRARILMLTVSEDEHELAAALRAGASGYLLKTMEGDELARAIRRAMLGHSVVAEELTGKLVAALREPSLPALGEEAAEASSPLDSLSPREREILQGITRGESNKAIARNLGIAETTVKIHVQHVLRKLDVPTRVHAAVMASTQTQNSAVN